MLGSHQRPFDQAWALGCGFGPRKPEAACRLVFADDGGAGLGVSHRLGEIAFGGNQGIGSPIGDMQGGGLGSVRPEAAAELGVDVGFEVGARRFSVIGWPPDGSP